MSSTKTYKSLILTDFNPKLSDAEVKDILYKEFKRYGIQNINIVKDHIGHRKVYAHFKYFEDAMGVRSKHKNKTLDLDPNINIEPLFDEKKCDYSSDNKHRGFLDETADDRNLTRTLFIGNLGYDITARDLAEVFGEYGYIEDIDIKKGPSHTTSMYAFIRFRNSDMARKAKSELSGKYIGKNQCRIGYGKHAPSNCLWVGGLSPQVSMEILKNCFSPFNPLRVEWPYGKQYAYLVFSSLDVASSVLMKMQGFEIAPNVFLRLDYSDETQVSMLLNSTFKPQMVLPSPLVAPQIPANLSHPPDQKQESSPLVFIFDLIPLSTKQAIKNLNLLNLLTNYLPLTLSTSLQLNGLNFSINLHFICGQNNLLDQLREKEKKEQILLLSNRISSDHQKLEKLFAFVNSPNPDLSLFLVTIPPNKPNPPLNWKSLKTLISFLKKKKSYGLTLLPQQSSSSRGMIHWITQGPHLKQLLSPLLPGLQVSQDSKDDSLLAIVNNFEI